ncbi:hypothetical protein Pa4123_08850 [Phytohabitans aurantiacus]|uniref:Uncharacterized protein n=1 Tax=Phytohabitans aurantiacus TaxID=3016789 RepID=A0ABQ5QMI4_9ACTN|nr:hypothetical protein Pa4123_08850 [Phytohabitans aurantiacus]
MRFGATLIGPAGVHRSTGTFREPEALVELSRDVVLVLSEADEPAAGVSVIALIVHTASRHAAAIGVFASAAACRSWWYQPFNRLLRDPDVLLVLAQICPDS